MTRARKAVMTTSAGKRWGFGPSDGVCQAILDMSSSTLGGLLYRNAGPVHPIRIRGYEPLGRDSGETRQTRGTRTDGYLSDNAAEQTTTNQGLFASLTTISMANQVISLFEKSKTKDTGRCNGGLWGKTYRN